ncbi:MAG: hypothetical protein VW982_00120 [Candidatus Poseidoniales archaeon]|jgi:predicted RNA binding protein with dsRBD fold (UPF0201 family)
MEGSRLRLTGTGEGFTTRVSTVLQGADSPQAVLQALHRLFPDAAVEDLPDEPSFGRAVEAVWTFENLSLAGFLEQLHEQRILDTALDAMSHNMNGETTVFEIARLAAVAGKVAFPIPDDRPLGGVFEITISGNGLADWLQAATWHAGRSQVPRHINDERSMDDDGESTTWI